MIQGGDPFSKDLSKTSMWGTGDPGYKFDDASITSQVKMVLMSYRSTSSLYTGVATQDGEVTLSRMARNEAERTLASKIVGDVKGVEKVNNTMTIAMPVANL
jgi:osmotically-inducible protein OsmY